MTKEQIVRFAARHLCDNYVAAYKRKGEDTNFKAIEKPVITPLPINRDTTSVFMQAILDSKVPPIAPAL